MLIYKTLLGVSLLVAASLSLFQLSKAQNCQFEALHRSFQRMNRFKTHHPPKAINWYLLNCRSKIQTNSNQSSWRSLYFLKQSNFNMNLKGNLTHDQ